MTSTPRQKRGAAAGSLAAQQEARDAEMAALNDRIRALEASNSALGKAIGRLQALNEEEPGGEQPAEGSRLSFPDPG